MPAKTIQLDSGNAEAQWQLHFLNLNRQIGTCVTSMMETLLGED